MDEKKSYYVQLPGSAYGQTWDEEKYNRNAEKLNEKYPDAVIMESSPYKEDYADTDQFHVTLPGDLKGQMWDGAKLRRNREKLLQKYPDAQIIPYSPIVRENFNDEPVGPAKNVQMPATGFWDKKGSDEVLRSAAIIRTPQEMALSANKEDVQERVPDPKSYLQYPNAGAVNKTDLMVSLLPYRKAINDPLGEWRRMAENPSTYQQEKQQEWVDSFANWQDNNAASNEEKRRVALENARRRNYEGMSDADRLVAKAKDRRIADSMRDIIFEDEIAMEKKENERHRLPGFLQGWSNAVKNMRQGVRQLSGEVGKLIFGDEKYTPKQNALGYLTSFIENTGGTGTIEQLKASLTKENGQPFYELDINKGDVLTKSRKKKYEIEKEFYDALMSALNENGGEIEKTFDALNKEVGGKMNRMQYLTRDVAKELQSMPEANGFGAWLGGLMPMIGITAAGMGAGSAFGASAAQFVGKASMGSFAASMAGESMNQARQYGASDAEVWGAGLSSAAIMYAMSKIPFDKFTNRVMSSTSKQTSRQLAEALNNPESSIAKESQALWDAFRKTYGTEKLFSQANFNQWLKDIVSTGTNFGTMTTLESIVPMIYENPQDYPSILEILKNGAQGFMDGAAFGAVTGAAAISARHSQNIRRWNEQGGMIYGAMNDGSVAEVIAIDGKPVRIINPKDYYNPSSESIQNEVHNGMYGKVSPLQPGEAALYTNGALSTNGINPTGSITVLHNGEVKTFAKEQIPNLFKAFGKRYTQSVVEEYMKTLRDISTDEQSGITPLMLDAEVRSKEEGLSNVKLLPPGPDGFTAEELAGGTMTDAQVNAAMDYNVVKSAKDEAQMARRTELTEQIQEAVGKPFWRSNQPEGVEKPIETVTSFVKADGHEVFVVGEKDGKFATVDDEGRTGFIEREKIVDGLGDGSITKFNENMPIDVYLDGKIVEQDAMSEAERINTEYAENLTALQEAVMQMDGKFNLGSPEAEQLVPIIDMNPTIEGGITVQTEEGVRVLPWKEIAQRLNLPFEPKTNEQLITEKIEADKQLAKDMEYPIEEGKLPADPNLMNKTSDDGGSGEPPAGGASPVPQKAFDDPVANEMGIPADFLTTTKKGRNVVNTGALWNQNPALLIAYNDRTNTLSMNSMDYLNAKIAQVDTEIAKQQALLQKEVLSTNDEDKKEEYKDKIDELTKRRQQIADILQPYIDAQAAAEAAAKAEAEAAKALKEQEKADREAIKAEEQDESLREPMSLEEVVANFISEIKPNQLNKEDFAKELGWGEEEMKRFFPYWAKSGKGYSVQKLAEWISQEDTSGFIPQLGDADQADEQAYVEGLQQAHEEEIQEVGVSESKDNGNLGITSVSGENVEDMPAEIAGAIQQARREVDTNPTEAQKEAGNYKKGHLDIEGYDFTLENPKGSVRSGKDASGKEWSQVMNNDYGYIRGTEGVDGDHIDMFLSDNPTEGNVFVIDQVDPKTGKFDEHKVMYGFNSAEEARAAYLANYEEGWQGLGTITEVTKDEFRKWIDSSHRKTKPFIEYKSVKTEGAQNEGASDEFLEDMPEDLFAMQSKVFEFLGTTREQAVTDRLQDKLTDIDNRMVADAKGGKLTKDSYMALMDEKAAALQEFGDAMSTDKDIECVATQLAKLRDVMIDKGVNPYSIQKTMSAISYATAHNEYPRGFKLAGKVFLLADNIFDARLGRRTYTHEEEHLITKAKGDAAKLAAMPGFSREAALDAIDTMNGFRSETYHRLNDENVADELISHGVEFGEGMSDADFDKFMQSVGVDNEEITNFVKNRIHERRARKRKLLSEDGRRSRTDTLEHVSTQGDLGQDERNLEPRSEGNVGEQGSRPIHSGSSGVGEGGQVAGGESAGRSDSEHPDANHAGAVRRAGEDLSPAERARVEDLDRDGTHIPEVTDNLDDATEGTSLFSLDKSKKSLVGLHNISADKLRKAIRLGGFANPSAAVIDLNYQNHFEYGDITFVMPSSLVDKRAGRNAGTWVRDAWTPTFPHITFHETKESQKNLKELLKDLPKDIRFAIDRKVYDFINGDTYHSGLEYVFLKEKGMEPEIQRNPRKYPNASVKEFFEKYLKHPEMSWNETHGSDIMDAYEALSPEDRKMANMYVLRDGDMTKIEHALEMEKKWPHLKEVHEEPLSFAQVDSFLYKIMRDERDAGEENIGLTIQKAIDIVEGDKALVDEFNAWQDKTIDALGYEAKMFIGYTDNGRKYKKATLENVSKEMKKEGNAGAQQNSGLSFGSIMASMAKKMNSLSEIRSNRERLVTKDKYQEEREKLMDDAKEFFFTFYDENIAKKDGLYTAELVAADYVRDFFVKGQSIDKVVETYNREQHKHLTLTDEEKAAFNDFRQRLIDAPTDMFETKFERPVYLNEFAAVVIPEDTPVDIKQTLEQSGIKVYEYKGDERSDERAAAVRKAAESSDDILFAFAGRVGAERMDRTEGVTTRLNNLAVAKGMEKEGKGAAAIKYATGWERGFDDKWRYEIPDFKSLDLYGDAKFKKTHPDYVRMLELVRKSNAAALMPEEYAPLSASEEEEYLRLQEKYSNYTRRKTFADDMLLDDFIDADDLFKAYPRLRDWNVHFDDNLADNVGGYADVQRERIVLNMKRRFQYERLGNDLVHEIQHAIQDIEGFSAGTNLQAAAQKAKVLNAQPKEQLSGNERDFLYLGEYYYNSLSSEYRKEHSLADWVKDQYGEEFTDNSFYKNNVEGKSADDLRKFYNQLLIKSKKKWVISSWDVYKRTSGEVEARNVTARRGMTAWERTNSLASDTEDVSRADQILNMPASSLLDIDDILEDRDFSSAQAAQKQPNMKLSEIDNSIDEDIMFSLSRSNRATVQKWLDKREDLSKEQKVAMVAYLDELSNPTLQLATARWFTQGTIRLPEDMPKVEQAVSVAAKAKVDPLKYGSPMELLDAHAGFKASEKRINPDDVSTLHKAKEFKEHGITIYDVDNTEESRQNMRQIINTHYGKEASPWCLLQGDGNGNLTEQSARFWQQYNGYPKQVAFKDGKLLGFSANDDKKVRLWWDRQDKPHYDIPAGWRPIKGDALGREVQYVYSENGMLKPEENSFMKKGNRENGEYTEWYPNGNLSEHGFFKNGKPDGVYETYNERKGYLYDRITYKEGVQEGMSEYFYDNGNLRSRTYWKNGRRDGSLELFYEDGTLNYIRHYKNGNYDGLAVEYNHDGSPVELIEYKDGLPHGKHELYYSDGKHVRLVGNYERGALHGAKIKYDYTGYPKSIENYVHGARQGVQEYYDYGPHKLSLRTFEKDNIVRKSEGFYSDGQLTFVKHYNEYGNPDGIWKFWTRDGKLDRMLQYKDNGREVRDLLAEGIPSWEAEDEPLFSMVTEQAEIDRLEKEPTITAYRAMALVDGKLYPPMSQKEPNAPSEKGQKMKVRPASELGKWEKADEAPEKAYEKDGKWYFDLKKTGGRSDVNGVLYNPYIHTSASPLNDQFSSASSRPELVTVEVEIPMSELAGKYKAEKANDSVGAKDWHSGSVTAQLGEGRQVILSRWAKPVRIVPDSEVAAMIAPKLKEKNITVPYNVVTPSLRDELQKQGVSIADQPLFSMVNANQEIFVSNAAKAVEGITMEKATPEQWLKMIEKNGGLKAGEDKWIGLSDWLKGKMQPVNFDDYWDATSVKWENVGVKEGAPIDWIKDYKKRGEVKASPYRSSISEYVLDKENGLIYRYSDHWGKVGTCNWPIDEETIHPGGQKGITIGVAKISDFKHLPLTKQEVLDYINENKIQIEEQWYHNEESEEKYVDNVYPGFADAFEIETADEDVYVYLISRAEAEKLYEQVEGKSAKDLVDAELEEFGFNLASDLQKNNKQRLINGTRLDYTASGLENKREIALMVPTIEPWNENDLVHFGDAGNGRAVAWIRFGDAKAGVKTFDEVAMDSAEKVRKELESFIDGLRKKYGPYRYDLDMSDEERQRIANLSADYRKLADISRSSIKIKGERKVLFIDEIQSKRHQEGREQGGYRKPFDEFLEERSLGFRETDTAFELYRKNDGSTHTSISKTLPEAKTAESAKSYIARMNYMYNKGVPAAPFEKNWHELAMKRMLRLAAEEGYDYVAWTTGAQQGERYNLGTTIHHLDVSTLQDGRKQVEIYPNYRGYADTNNTFFYRINDEGIITDTDSMGSQRDAVGKPAREVFGKGLSEKIMQTSRGEISGEGLRIDNEGMRGFYDQMLPAFMNKYGKKWGVKVEDIELPNIEGGIYAHAVPVTEEMKASVMEGQPMFSFTKTAPNGKPSNLDDERYDMVRTDEFKRWAGDWLADAEAFGISERLHNWINEENISKARSFLINKTKEGRDAARKAIFEYFGNELHPIAYLPKDDLDYFASNLSDNRIYSGMGYFIDHAAIQHPEVKAEEYDYIQQILNNPDSRKTTSQNSIAYVKKFGKGYAVVLQLEQEEGKIILHKSFFYRDDGKMPYRNMPDAEKKKSSEGGRSSISPADKTTAGSLLSARDDNAKVTNYLIPTNNSTKVVDENGEPRIMYRGDDYLKDSKYVGGRWLSFDKKFAEGFGEVREYFVNARNPFDGEKDAESLRSFIEEHYDEIRGEYDLFFDVDQAYNSVDEIVEAIKERQWEALEQSDLIANEIFRRGYDAIYVDEDDTQNIMVRNGNQIKLAEPTTYDDNGNEIPQSERFSEENDVRFSLTSRQEAIKAVDEKGLAGIMDSEEASELRRGIYMAIPAEIRAQIVDKALGGDLNIKNALNDYLVNLAKGGTENDETGLLRELYNQIRDLSGNENLTDADCRYIIWREAEGNKPLSFISEAAYKNRFGAGKEEPMFSMTAYHGGGKTFDRFSTDHIGEGQGAQSHGWGLYVAFTKDVSKRYAEVMGHPVTEYVGKKAPTYYSNELISHIKVEMADGRSFDEAKQSVVDMLRKMEEDRKSGRLPSYWEKTSYEKDLEFFESIKASDFEVGESHKNLYTVSLPEDTGVNYIEEDKKLSEGARQKIADALRSLPSEKWSSKGWHFAKSQEQMASTIEDGRYIGLSLYANLSAGLGSSKAASEFLSDAGVVGIKYDGKMDGPCAVIFDEKDITIDDHAQFSFTKEFGDITEENREKAGEAVAAAAEALKESKAEAKEESKASAAKAILKAMRGQKAYDKATVDAIVRLAKDILKDGKISTISRKDVNRLLGLVNTSVGKSPAFANKYADLLLDNMLGIIVKNEEEKLEDLINIKDKVVNQSGVEAMGKLDLLGQETMKALRAYRTKSLEDIQARQVEISDQLSSANDAVRKRAWAEKAGLDLAEQYVNTIGQSELEEYGLKQELNELKESKQAGAIGKDAYKEFEADTKQAIRENKMDRVDAYRTMVAALSTEAKKSIKARAAFAEAEEARVDAIHHDANRDLYGESAGIMNKESWLSKVVNKPVFRFFFQPLATFDQMMRMLAKHNVTGEGYLYNRFMRGWLKAREQYLTSLRDGNKKLDAKVSEVFGKEMKWVDLYSLDKKLPTMEVRMWDKEKMADIELTQGQLLYIYMVNKMTDGKMKLRKMGISEENVADIRENLDPRFLELADWLQTEYLPERRNYYNAVHEKLFGAPMAAIEDYFPLKIAEGDRYEEVDVAKETPESALSSTVTAHIIKRTKNAKMLDILNANAFDVAMEHLESMEEWAAMAPFRKDLNTLLSYSHFRNQVKNMTTIYGSGNQLWRNFVNVSRIVSGTYNPEGKGSFLVNVSKGVTSGKINFRLHTALKQMLSYPAFWTEARADDLAKGLANPLKSWNWCMENLPVFKHRWEKRTIGDTRLMESDSDWKVWKKNFVKKASRYGMTPNALIDALTIAVGSKAVYDAKYRKYIADGMAEAEADRRAKDDATIIYNQSQQSDEDAFVAAVQKDRTFEAAGITTFRNASMGYQRKVHNAYRTLGRLVRGNKEAMIDSAARQYVSEGMEWEQAKARAEKEWKRAGAKAAGDLFIYQFFLNYLWKIGPLGLAYILMGDNDDKRKNKLIDPLVTTAITGFFEGLSTGGTTTDVIGGLVSGDNYNQWTFLGNPILQDIQNLGNTIKNKGVDTQSAYEVISLLAQGWCGVDPRLLSDTYAAVVDATNGDMGIGKEIAFLLMRIAQMPQSVMKDFYIDEIQMTAKEAGKKSAKELAERYVQYKKMRRDPLGEIIPKSKDEEKKEKQSDKTATTKLMNDAFPKQNKNK